MTVGSIRHRRLVNALDRAWQSGQWSVEEINDALGRAIAADELGTGGESC